MVYITTEEVTKLHDEILCVSGGLQWNLNIGQLDSLLTHIQNDTYYPSMPEKAAHIMFGIIKFHIFIEGCKRTSTAALTAFLALNSINIDYLWTTLKNMAIDVEQNKISKDALVKHLRAILVSSEHSLSE